MRRQLRLATGSALLLLACSSPGNTGRSGPSNELVGLVPWTNGAVPLVDGKGQLVMPIEPVYPPIGANTPDPGSRPIDCSPLSDIELSPYWMDDFEPAKPTPEIPDPIGIAHFWSSNDDETEGAFRVPGDSSWYLGLVPGDLNPNRRYPDRFGLAAQRITGAPSCDSQPNEWVFHFRGGRFNYYGAAAERPLQAREIRENVAPAAGEPEPPGDERCPAGSDLCPPAVADDAVIDPVGLPLRRPNGDKLRVTEHFYLDVSAYDGVTFWARRGPDGQPGMLLALQDKHTSDALNRERNTFCRRIKQCRPTCQNNGPCTLDPIEGVHRCFDPAVGLPPIVEPALREEVYPRCGPSACQELSYYPDADLEGTECKFFEFSGSQANYYCFKDVAPPPDDERCGDAWVAPVRLSTDWQIYVIPFDEFRQVGFAKRAPLLDLHSIYSIALQFPVGFADVYVDNVSFYRRRR